MKAFVTGGTGFLGTHLVTALLARGDEVRCLVRAPARATALARNGVRLVTGDLTDQRALEAGCRGADVVFHLAGAIAASSRAAFLATNRDGTVALLAAAAATPPRRFVYVSSVAAVGPSARGQPLDETAPTHPVTPYGESKLAGEQAVRAAALPWTIIRPPWVYGEWDRAGLPLFRLAARGVVPLIGDGAQELSLVHATDVAQALLAAASAERAVGRVYFAAHPELTTAREMARAVGRAVGRAPLIVPIPRPLAYGAVWTIGSVARALGRASVVSPERAGEFFAPAWTCSAAALHRDTGWEARIDLATGLKRTADWYRGEGWLG